MSTEVCSIYFLEDQTLYLRAAIGLAESVVGEASLALGEGLVGHTAKSSKIINVVEPQNDSRYKHVVGSDEERYHSFLGLPLFDRDSLVGVMALQTVAPRKFEPLEVSTLSTIALQLSNVFVNARLLDELASSLETSVDADALDIDDGPLILDSQRGFGEVAIAPAHLYLTDQTLDTFSDIEPVRCDAPELETDLLNRAIAAARLETVALERNVASRLSHSDAAIFHAHLAILQDQAFLNKIQSLIELGRSAVWATGEVVRSYVRSFQDLADPYLRERAADVEDVGRRVRRQLTLLKDQTPQSGLGQSPSSGQRFILVAPRLDASDIASMNFDHLAAIVLAHGDTTSHAAIVARSLGIPTLLGIQIHGIHEGDPLIVDAGARRLYVRPTKAVETEFLRLLEDRSSQRPSAESPIGGDAKTKDGTKVSIRATIGLRSDLPVATHHRAKGVGLYRTELPFMARSSMPDRDTQAAIYREVIEAFPDERVTIRTLDVGGDKSLPYLPMPHEANPFLGWRSVRFSLDHRDWLVAQIEAVLMASANHSDVGLMFPMVTTMNQWEACMECLDEARDHLREQMLSFGKVRVGIMVETPAVVTMIDQFAPIVDFVSIGTNDLTQYLLAVDRGNERVSNPTDGLHPSVLRSIARVVEVSQGHHTPVSICGEMAHDASTLALLI
ncbi:MAG: phosphoenolpyruvate--protein phosphotransferase, partial [Planctomycetota bacterium]